LRQKEIKITGALTFGNQWFYFLEIAMSGKSVLVFNGALPFLFIIAPDKTVFQESKRERERGFLVLASASIHSFSVFLFLLEKLVRGW